MFTDLRQALRTLLKSPGFSALVVVVLAVGIGANTAIFSIVNGVLLKPLPFAHANRLVAVDTTVNGEPDDSSYPDFEDWREQSTSFERLAAYTTAAVTVTGSGEAQSVPSAVVTSDLFPALGAVPLRGRVFNADDDKRGAARTVIIAESLWTSRFGGDAGIVGRSITLDAEPFTVIGVMPARFEFPFDAEDPPQLWMPIFASRFAAQWAGQRNASFLKSIGLLQTGVTPQRAQSDVAAIESQSIAKSERSGTRSVIVRPFQDVLVKNYRLGLLVLLSAVGSVLLIACANVANLLLARGSVRRREIAVRAALGASRSRIVRQLLAESLTLACIGGIVGAVLSLWAVDALVRFSPLQIPRLHAVRLDSTALAFTALVSLATGVLSGIVPAFQLSRANSGDALKETERGGSSVRGARTRQVLVVAEVAVSLMLLTAAGLLVRSFVALQHVSPGFLTERAVAMQLLLPQSRYPDAKAMVAFSRKLRDELPTLPGVSASAIATTLPMSGSDIGVGYTIEGRPADPKTRTAAAYFAISADYFSTLGIPMLRGRPFTDRDNETAPAVLIVNQTFAAKYWPNEDPIGKRVTIGYNNTGPREIVGVVGDVKQGALADTSAPQMYAPFVQTPWPFITAVVRTTAAPESAIGSLRKMLARIDPMQGAGDLKTLDQYVSRSIATPRFTTVLVGAFATLALLLAALGLFSVMAYSVAQRRREIGIRMALGAQAADVRSLVLRQAVQMGLVGLAVGLIGAVATTRVIDSLLFGITAHDPVTFAAVSGMLLTVMLLAAYLPARRATRVDPIIALRTE
jgi:putative ABC transport system permease protein